jgi:hypothetical protein
MNNTNDPFPLPFHAKAFRALLPMFAVLSLLLASAHGATPIPAGSRVLFLGNGADALMTEMTNITAGDQVASAANLTFDSYDLNDNPPFTRNLVSALFLDRTYPKFYVLTMYHTSLY